MMLLSLYYHLTYFEFTHFCCYYSLPAFQCRSLNPIEATERRRNHRPGLRGPKLPVINEVKFCNVPTLESFGTLSMFICSLILSDWLTEYSKASVRCMRCVPGPTTHKITGLNQAFGIIHKCWQCFSGGPNFVS